MMSAQEAMFGAGCFWGVEATFAHVPGVLETVVGYAGGTLPNPTYDQVCSHSTGHAEVIWLRFDPAIISYTKLLEIFFEIHNPTLLNRQGPDIGSQYRSVIFYDNEEQHDLAFKAIEDLEAAKKYDKKIVTQVVPTTPFYRAEEYHQRYLEKKGQSHCGK